MDNSRARESSFFDRRSRALRTDYSIPMADVRPAMRSQDPFDLARAGLGAAFDDPSLLRGGAADIVKGAVAGFPLPAPFRSEYNSWPGTDEPWNEKTLNSDSRPTWQPGYLEKMLYGDPNAPATLAPSRSTSNPQPSALSSNTPMIRSSAAAAGIPDRYNVFEFGYPPQGD
jgi:hypothetical protein